MVRVSDQAESCTNLRALNIRIRYQFVKTATLTCFDAIDHLIMCQVAFLALSTELVSSIRLGYFPHLDLRVRSWPIELLDGLRFSHY